MNGCEFDSPESRIRCVLFDAVGTLIFPNPDVVKVYHQFGVRIGSSADRPTIAQRFSTAFRRIFETEQTTAHTDETVERDRWFKLVQTVFADVTVSQPDFQILWDHFADPSHWSMFDDAAPAIANLQMTDLQLGIASNFDRRLTDICAAFGPLSRLDHLLISTDIGCSKPSTAFFRQIERRLGLRPNEILIIGDSVRNDIVPALECGWQTCLIDRTGEQPVANTTVISSLLEYRPS